MKIGIVGGTFNPIHLGHLMLGEYAYREFNLDEIWFMPNGNPPHKQLSEIAIATKHRIAMTESAVCDTEYFKVSKFEIEKDHISYSYKTMDELTQLYPEHEYFFIVGSDSLLMIEQWRCPEKLLSKCTILVAIRESVDNTAVEEQIQYLHQKYTCKIQLLPMPIFEISSSDIRNRIRMNKTIKYVLPEATVSYIREHELYIS